MRNEINSSLKKEFDNAYSMLCEKLYLAGALSYKDIKGSAGEAEDIRIELTSIKAKIDSQMKYFTRSIYRKLKIKFNDEFDSWF